jgi:hypothetical protein
LGTNLNPSIFDAIGLAMEVKEAKDKDFEIYFTHCYSSHSLDSGLDFNNCYRSQ